MIIELWSLKNSSSQCLLLNTKECHMKEYRKLYQQQVSKVTLHFVWATYQENKQFDDIIGNEHNILDDKEKTPGSSMPYRESDNYEDDKFDSESEDGGGNEEVVNDQSDGQSESIAEEISTDEK